MKKILEWQNKDFIKGQSAQPNLTIGGLFQKISNWDPFEQAGVVLPSLTPATQALGTTPKFLTSFNSANTDYIYAHSTTKLYQILKDSPYTVTDETAQVYNGAGTPDVLLGRTIWKNNYIYAFHSSTPGNFIRANSLPVASGNDVLIKTLSLNSPNVDYIAMCTGADGNLYTGNYLSINEMTSVTGTSGNSLEFFIDTGFTVRDILNDGRYLVIIADNNAAATTSRRVGSYTGRIYFWDMVQTDANSRIVPIAMWDISDSYLIAGASMDEGIYVLGYNGLYICNVSTKPKMVRAFPTDSTADSMVRPLNPSQVAVSKGSLYWIDGINTIASTGVYNTDVYAYGNPTTGQQKIFYRPYTTGVNHLNTCLLISGKNCIVGSDAPGLNFFNVGTTRGTATTESVNTNMESPYTYGFTKVVLAQPLTSGQSVTVTAFTQGSNVSLSSETKTYAAANPKQTLLFRRIPPGTNNPDKFADITLLVTSVGAQVVRVSTYADPLVDTNEDI